VAELSGGAALVAALARHGVSVVFGIPGTHNLAVYAALHRHGIRHVLPRHEQGAGYAADGYARATGRPGVCLTTTGPGLLNALTAAAQAYSDSVPVLLISPGMPLAHAGRGTGELHEVRRQSGAVEAVLGRSHRVGSVAEIPGAVAQAFADMRTGRPRPVHLEIPLDLLDAVADTEVVAPLPVARSVPDEAVLYAAVARLSASEAPGIIAGGGARTASAELSRLAERLGAPVVTTAGGKGVLPEDHPLSLGAGLHHKAVAAFAAECDVVLAVGTELAPADLWYGPLPLAGRLIRVDIDPSQLVSGAAPSLAVAGDAAATLSGLLDRMPQRRVSKVAGARPHGTARADRWRTRIRAEARTEGARWLDIVGALAEALGRDGILAGDSTMACYYGALSNLPAYRHGTFLYPTGFGTLGYGLPAAIGAKVGCPDTRVAALHGDGGLMFTVAELASAAALRLPLPVIVVDNGGYGEIRDEMAQRGDPVHAVDFAPPDLPALAVALGCHGVTVKGRAELAGALHSAFAADRPTLIHISEQTGEPA
jgi:acetolactate synthase-1/2/3 large subunit